MFSTERSSERCKQEETACTRHQSLKEKARTLTAAEETEIDTQVSVRIRKLKAAGRALEAADFAAGQGAPVKPRHDVSPRRSGAEKAKNPKEKTGTKKSAKDEKAKKPKEKTRTKKSMKDSSESSSEAKKQKEKTGAKRSQKDAQEKRRADQFKKVSSSKKYKVDASESSRSKSLSAPSSRIHRRKLPTSPRPPSLPAARDFRSPARQFDPESACLIDWETSIDIQKAPWRKK